VRTLPRGLRRIPPRWRVGLAAGAALVLAGAIAIVAAIALSSGPSANQPAADARPVLSPALVASLRGAGALDRRCVVVLADPAELRAAAGPLARRLAAVDAAPYDRGAAERMVAAACQTAPPAGRVLPALAADAQRAARGDDPGEHLCAALHADRGATVGAAGRAIATNRALADLFDQGRRPGLDRLFGAVATSEQRGRVAAVRLRALRLRTHAARELRDDLAGLLVRWSNAGYLLRDGASDADAWVAEVGALDAVDRIESWFADLSDLRARANAIEDRSEAPVPGAPADCGLGRLLLLR